MSDGEPVGASGGLPGVFAALYADAGPLRRAAFEAVRHRQRLTPAELAEFAGLGLDDVEGLLDRLTQAGLVRQDDQRRIIGIAGLSLEPTAHQLRLEGSGLFTWCAIDAIGIPAALGIDAQVTTRCRHCDATIELRLRGGNPPIPSDQRVWLPQSACTNVFDQFCSQANMFCNTKHLQEWHAATDAPGRALDLADTAALGRESWAEFT